MPSWTAIEVIPGVSGGDISTAASAKPGRARTKPLAERDPNRSLALKITSSEKTKQKKSAKGQFEDRSFSEQYEYLCLPIPQWAHEEEDDDQKSSYHGSEEGAEESTSSVPDYEWVAMRETIDLLEKYNRLSSYCDPDNFDLCIANNTFAYGIIELLENLLKSCMTPMSRSPNVHQMWANIAILGHFLNSEAHEGAWLEVEDRARVDSLCGVIGCAILTALNHLDRIGQLAYDSAFEDLGLIMALYIRFSYDATTTVFRENDQDVNWQDMILAYAYKADIDLSYQGVAGLGDALDPRNSDVDLLESNVTASRWSWSKVLAEYREAHGAGGTIGGSRHNILSWSREQRAQYHLEKRDPMHRFRAKEMTGTQLIVPDCIRERDEEASKGVEDDTELFAQLEKLKIAGD